MFGYSIDGGDKMKIAGLLSGLFIWWYFIGRRKYGIKGMRRYV